MAEQQFHIGIKAVIRNQAGQIFLLNEPKPGSDEARWDIPGGRMDKGETFQQTLARELGEELGMSYDGEPAFVKAVVSNITVPTPTGEVGLMLMAYSIDVADLDSLQPAEPGTTYEWVSSATAADRLARKYPPEFCEFIASL